MSIVVIFILYAIRSASVDQRFNRYVYRGYYTVARRYVFYFRVAKQYFKKRAQRVSKILFLPRENKIHIFKPPGNVLFII